MFGEFVDLAIFLVIVAVGAAMNEYFNLTHDDTVVSFALLLTAAGLVWLSSLFLIRRKATPGLAWIGLQVTTPEGEPLPRWQALTRQALLVGWAVVNSFFGVGWLVASPIIISKSRRHQNFYDNLVGSVVSERPKSV